MSSYISECIAELFAEGLSFVSKRYWYYSRLDEIPFYQQLNSSDVGFGNLSSISRVCIVEGDQDAMSSEPSTTEAESRVAVVVLGVNFNSVRSVQWH
jgi:hypothetical protein